MSRSCFYTQWWLRHPSSSTKRRMCEEELLSVTISTSLVNEDRMKNRNSMIIEFQFLHTSHSNSTTKQTHSPPHAAREAQTQPVLHLFICLVHVWKSNPTQPSVVIRQRTGWWKLRRCFLLLQFPESNRLTTARYSFDTLLESIARSCRREQSSDTSNSLQICCPKCMSGRWSMSLLTCW